MSSHHDPGCLQTILWIGEEPRHRSAPVAKDTCLNTVVPPRDPLRARSCNRSARNPEMVVAEGHASRQVVFYMPRFVFRPLGLERIDMSQLPMGHSKSPYRSTHEYPEPWVSSDQDLKGARGSDYRGVLKENPGYFNLPWIAIDICRALLTKRILTTRFGADSRQISKRRSIALLLD